MIKRCRSLKQGRVPRISKIFSLKRSFKKEWIVSFRAVALACLGTFFLQLVSAYAVEEAPPPNTSVLENAVRLCEAGQIEKAEREIKKALDFDPANFSYHFELANVYAAQYDRLKGAGQNEASKEALKAAGRELEQAVMIDPKHIPARFNLGVIYKKQRHFEESRKHFREVLKLDSNKIPGLMQIGATYEDQGFFDEAQSVYLEARELDFNNPDIRLTLDELEKRKGEAQQCGNLSSGMDGFAQLARLQSVRGQKGLLQPDADRGQNLGQAVPYLGALLLQQFMKGRQSKK